MTCLTCLICLNLGYQKENGDHVCKWGLNFDYRRNSYDVNHAVKCKEFDSMIIAPTNFKFVQVVKD